MVTFGMNYDVRPGQEARFETAMRAVVHLLDGLEGHRETRLYRDVQRPNGYLVYSAWDNREGFARFTASPEFRRAVALGDDLLLGPPSHRIFVEEHGPRAQ